MSQKGFHQLPPLADMACKDKESLYWLVEKASQKQLMHCQVHDRFKLCLRPPPIPCVNPFRIHPHTHSTHKQMNKLIRTI